MKALKGLRIVVQFAQTYIFHNKARTGQKSAYPAAGVITFPNKSSKLAVSLTVDTLSHGHQAVRREFIEVTRVAETSWTSDFLFIITYDYNDVSRL